MLKENDVSAYLSGGWAALHCVALDASLMYQFCGVISLFWVGGCHLLSQGKGCYSWLLSFARKWSSTSLLSRLCRCSVCRNSLEETLGRSLGPALSYTACKFLRCRAD